jgi:RsiW-degrading membrane proteinase PrsW (M82 family)
MFLTGLFLWLASVVVTYVTGNANLIPTIVLLGSFLVPVTFAGWAFERRQTGEITGELVFRMFTVGGVLGVLAASVLESYLLHPSPFLFVGVGLIEEAVKLFALAILTRHLAVKSMRDGMILGAAVGFGFAAFESAGYALTALVTENGVSLTDLVTTEVLRGLLAPLGHGLWTAILGGVLFATSSGRRFRITGKLIAAYLGVALLHALWDSMHGIAVVITLLLTGDVWQYELLSHGWIPRPTPIQVELMTVFNWIGLAIVSVIGLGWLRFMVRASKRSAAVSPPPGAVPQRP